MGVAITKIVCQCQWSKKLSLTL